MQVVQAPNGSAPVNGQNGGLCGREEAQPVLLSTHRSKNHKRLT
ncbi:UNVERIFIED_CONTAM: hypothetical protein C7454_10465 [Acidovorax defluvii]|jgi:hypothetical protein